MQTDIHYSPLTEEPIETSKFRDLVERVGLSNALQACKLDDLLSKLVSSQINIGEISPQMQALISQLEHLELEQGYGDLTASLCKIFPQLEDMIVNAPFGRYVVYRMRKLLDILTDEALPMGMRFLAYLSARNLKLEFQENLKDRYTLTPMHYELVLDEYDLSTTPLDPDQDARSGMNFMLGAAIDPMLFMGSRQIALKSAQLLYGEYDKPGRYFSESEMETAVGEDGFLRLDDDTIMQETFDFVYGDGAWQLLIDELTLEEFDRRNPVGL